MDRSVCKVSFGHHEFEVSLRQFDMCFWISKWRKWLSYKLRSYWHFAGNCSCDRVRERVWQKRGRAKAQS